MAEALGEMTWEGLLEMFDVIIRTYLQDEVGVRYTDDRRDDDRRGDEYPLLYVASLCLKRDMYGVGGSGSHEEERENVVRAITEMKETIRNNNFALVMQAAQNVTCYSREYEVRVEQNLDFMKMVYWYGWAVCGLFSGLKQDIAKAALLLFMDSSVLRYTKKIYIDRQIWQKLARSLVQDRNNDNFGRYGLYLVFKNTALTCQDVCKNGARSSYVVDEPDSGSEA